MDIIPKNSPFIFTVVLILHLLSGLAVTQTSLPWYIQVVFLIFVGAGLVPALINNFIINYIGHPQEVPLHHCWDYFIRFFTTPKIVKCYYKNNQWLLENAAGEVQQTTLLGNTFVSLPLIILNFPRHSILLSADVIDKDLLRKLRVMLLFF